MVFDDIIHHDPRKRVLYAGMSSPTWKAPIIVHPTLCGCTNMWRWRHTSQKGHSWQAVGVAPRLRKAGSMSELFSFSTSYWATRQTPHTYPPKLQNSSHAGSCFNFLFLFLRFLAIGNNPQPSHTNTNIQYQEQFRLCRSFFWIYI